MVVVVVGIVESGLAVTAYEAAGGCDLEAEAAEPTPHNWLCASYWALQLSWLLSRC